MNERPLLLPSLRRESINKAGLPVNEISSVSIPIQPGDEAEFERNINDFDAESQNLLNEFKNPEDQYEVEQGLAPHNLSSFLTNNTIYTDTLNELKSEIERDIGSKHHLDLNPKINKAQRINQIKDIIQEYMENKKLPKLNYYLDRDPGLKAILNKKDIDMIMAKERFQFFSPDKIAQKIIDERKGIDPDELEILEEIQHNMQRDVIARENNNISDQTFIDKINQYAQIITDQVLGGDINEYNRFEKEFKRKALIDLNILNDHIKKIKKVTEFAPNTKISQNLIKIINTTMNDLRNGKIDLNQAFDKINGSYKNFMPDRMAPLGPITLKGKYIREEKIAEPLSAIFINPDLDTKQKINDELNKEGAIAFEGVDIEGATKIMDNAYIASAKQKDKLYKSLTNLLGLTNFPGPKKISAGKTGLDVDFNLPKNVHLYTKAVIGGMMEDLEGRLRYLGIHLDPKVFPIFNQAANKMKMTALRSDIVNEFNKVYNTLKAMDTHLDMIKDDEIDMTNPTELLYNIRVPKIGDKISETRNRLKISALDIPEEIRPSPPEENFYVRPGETREQAKRRIDKEKRKEHSEQMLKYHQQFTKEDKDALIAQFGPNILEFDVKTSDQLLKMKQEVSKKEGKLYIIDLKTGRLFPIEIDKCFVGQTYIFMKNPETGGSFAENPALHKIYREEENLIPYKHLQFGRDKRAFRFQQTAIKPYTIDYRDQIRNEIGAGFWKSIKKGVSAAYHAPINAAKDVGSYVAHKTVSAAKDLANQTVYEAKNFVAQEKKNINQIAQSNKQFYKNPNLKGFVNAVGKTVTGSAKVLYQPSITMAREAANVSDFASKVPGLNVAKMGAEYFIPGLGVADALVHGVKNTGIGSSEKPKYLDTAINALDAVTGSNLLANNAQIGAKVLQTGLNVTDKFVDKH